MPPILNPFLRAFFRSTLPSQCSPVQHHILLVPTTEVLVNARDSDTNASYTDLSGSEEFLASHVLRIPGGVGPNNHVKDGASFRENRGKAKQYSTANGRTVIIKDAYVYSNKGFKTLIQAQLLNDVIFYPDAFEAQPWLVYFISRPLIGTYEATPIVPALLSDQRSPPAHDVGSSSLPKKKDVKSFGDLLNHFPMIARQMHPGLERLFREFGKELEKPLPPTPAQNSRRSTLSSRRRGSLSSGESLSLSLHSSISQGPNGYISNLEIGQEEEMMRASLETAVTAAIDLFQMVDKQQLSLLGATTDLTGPVVERMIERYITEQVHNSILFPRICSIRRSEDLELEGRIRGMVNVDISQVGIDIADGRRGKQELSRRLSKGVEIFKRMGVAGSPQEMVEILLAVQKHITMPDASPNPSNVETKVGINGEPDSEKRDHILTINADTLVSLLLIVVIRSPVRHLLARLTYMRHFIFIDDVESGEMGYCLSTFEAVLSYLARDANGLRRSSGRNRKLWHATNNGDLNALRSILDPTRSIDDAETDSAGSDQDIQGSLGQPCASKHCDRSSSDDLEAKDDLEANGDYESNRSNRTSSLRHRRAEGGSLAHIFPFQRVPTPPQLDEPKAKKKVSMDLRSMSNSSAYSIRSHTTVESHSSGLEFEGDVSIETLTKTHGPGGDSVLMMAIENKQAKALEYLLSLDEYYTLGFILDDCNNEGTTLLSAVLQIGYFESTEILLRYVLDHSPNDDVTRAYFAKQDSQGRCMAHYLFTHPHLIDRIGHLVPWKLKDKNGQSPLFALCRAYDHDEYREMVDEALIAATLAQDDGLPLHLDEHIDHKGNSLLHIINDPYIAGKLLYRCDSDANAPNDKHFTPLMVASKYGRMEVVRVLFQDARVDLSVRDVRGLTAVELAKDDEVRNRIDDLVLLSNEPGPDGRMTSVVRSYFVEDGTVRLIIKSGAPTGNSTITVTTCRRSVQDFESLARCLAQEHPASWMPVIDNLASPFLIPSRPSRSILRDIQLRLDSFLKTLLTHPTFSTHEMVWEFFLVPDIEPAMLAERSNRKSQSRIERIRDEYTPLYDVREVELFVQHARESVRSVHHASRSVLRRTNKMRNAASDLTDAAKLAETAIKSLKFLPVEHVRAIERYTRALNQSEANPLSGFYYNMHAVSDTINAILVALNRPSSVITSMSGAQKSMDRHQLSVRRSDRWPLGLLDDARARIQRDAQEKMDRATEELADFGRELRYTQQVVASELASWQEGRVKSERKILKALATKMVVVEKARLESMKRAIRGLELPKAPEANGTTQPDGPTTSDDHSSSG